MGPRNLTILFISTVAVSLVLLILLFSLLAKNVDISFDTKMPESAPDLGSFYKDGSLSRTRGDNVGGANVNVPQNASAVTAPAKPASGVGDEDLSKLQEDEPPVAGDTSAEGTDEVPTPPVDSTTKKDADHLDTDKPQSQVKADSIKQPVMAKPQVTKPVVPRRIDPESSTPIPTPAENPAPAGANQ